MDCWRLSLLNTSVCLVREEYSSIRHVLNSCRGVYTVLKVRDVEDVEFHVERVVRGYFLLKGVDELGDKKELIQQTLSSLMVNQFQEYQGIMCLVPIHGEFVVKMYGMNLVAAAGGVPNNSATRVGVSFSGPRNLPNVKDSEWCQERTKIEHEFQDVRVDEIVLVDPEDGRIYEGLVTNVFVKVDGLFYTSPSEFVLEGCERSKLISRLQDKVVFECARWSQVDSWQGMYLTNSLRGIKRVDQIIDTLGNIVKRFEYSAEFFRGREFIARN